MPGEVTRRITVALAGNPNVGKSTLFNSLTGLHQHTGNWPGKTVGVAQGRARRGGTEYTFVDLPGTYSLEGRSQEEQVAGEYLGSGQADCTVVVCDGSCLERSLILAMQIIPRVQKVVVCVNLMDEANRRGIHIDSQVLSQQLEVPVVLTAAGSGQGIGMLLDQIQKTAATMPPLQLPHWEDPVAQAQQAAQACTQKSKSDSDVWRRKVDALLVSRRFGIPLMFCLLLFIIWLTVWGANYPAELMEQGFNWLYLRLSGLWRFPLADLADAASGRQRQNPEHFSGTAALFQLYVGDERRCPAGIRALHPSPAGSNQL